MENVRENNINTETKFKKKISKMETVKLAT